MCASLLSTPPLLFEKRVFPFFTPFHSPSPSLQILPFASPPPIPQNIISKVKTYHKVLQAFVTNAKLELTVLVTLQVRVLLGVGVSG